jgi:CheY-like chemotaxis protein
MIQRVACATLERQDYQVRIARNGLDALEIFHSDHSRISLIILDLSMPIMSGEDTFHRLRQIRPDIPIIVSSGLIEGSAISRFEGVHPEGFLQNHIGHRS